MHSKPKLQYLVMLVGGTIGLVASFLQMLDKLKLLQQPTEPLVCNLNSVFSCTNVLGAWQSSVFGFPNSLMCIIFFSTIVTLGFVGLSGGTLVRQLRLAFQGITLFFLAFGVWYLMQSIYSIRALCIYCVFCFAGLLMINWSWLRLNVNDLPIGENIKTKLQALIKKNYDTLFWASIALIIAALTLIELY